MQHAAGAAVILRAARASPGGRRISRRQATYKGTCNLLQTWLSSYKMFTPPFSEMDVYNLVYN